VLGEIANMVVVAPDVYVGTPNCSLQWPSSPYITHSLMIAHSSITTWWRPQGICTSRYQTHIDKQDQHKPALVSCKRMVLSKPGEHLRGYVTLLRGARARRWQIDLVLAQAGTSLFSGGWSPVLSEHSHKRLVLMQVNAMCVEV
jgi:hypothetical protein